MRIEHLPSKSILAGILSTALAGCSSSEPTAPGAGGTSSMEGGAGGATGSARGGSATNGGSSSVGFGGSTPAGGAPSNGGAMVSGGTQSYGGLPGNGGSTAALGGSATGGKSTGSGGFTTGGQMAAGGVASGGRTSGAGGAGKGGSVGGSASGGTTGGQVGVGGSTATGGAAMGGNTFTGTCTASKAVNTSVTGSGPHRVTVETNSDSGIREGTIYRPTDLGGTEKYPIFAWGNGACSLNGLSNTAAMGEIASHGYFVIADGTPNGGGGRTMDGSNPTAMGAPLLAYITWAIAENEKPCSAYYHSLDTTKIATNGFSCGGLMAEGTSGDPRLTTWGITSSGLFGANQALYQKVHTPVLIILGGTSDMAYENGERDYDNISALGIPIMLFSKNIGHGGDLLAARGGDFTKINLAWLNWRLKNDETASGKGLLVGAGCTYCTNSAWEVKSKNIQ